MKDKIQIIIDNNVCNAANYPDHVSPAADAMTALMCYREVRALTKGRSAFLHVPNFIIAILKDDYQKDDILKAIEQVKKEII